MGLETNKVTYKKSWELLRLKELCTRISDGTHFTPEYISDGIPFISVKDIYDEKVHFEKCKYISKEAHQELIKRCYPEKDDVLITKSGTIGRMALVPDKPEFSLFVSVALLKNKKELIHSKFLKYCLENFLNHINIAQDIKGGLLKNFHLEDIRETLIPKVTLKEQKAIIDKIEELLSDLEKGNEQLELTLKQLIVYRQSLLKWIFDGKLTNRKVIDGELPKGWKISKLGEVCKTTSGGTPNRGNLKYYNGNIPWVKSGELNRGLILNTVEKITEEAIKNSSAKIFPKGTLLIALYGATIGKLAFLGIDAATNQAVCGIYKNENIDSNYLYYFLLFSKPHLVKQGIGGAQPNISQGILKNLAIPIPTMKEQQNIVCELESKLTSCDKIEETINNSLKLSVTLRQSILKKAFEGKLV